MDGLSKQLDKIIHLTNSMQEFAEKKDWETVSQLESERLAQIEAMFSHSISKQDSEKVRNTVEKIISIDESILKNAEQEKNEIHAQAKKLLLEKRAFEEYAKNR